MYLFDIFFNKNFFFFGETRQEAWTYINEKKELNEHQITIRRQYPQVGY